MISYNKTEKIDNLKKHGDMTTKDKIVLLKEFNDYKSKDETGPDAQIEQDDGEEENNEFACLSETSLMSDFSFVPSSLKSVDLRAQTTQP